MQWDAVLLTEPGLVLMIRGLLVALMVVVAAFAVTVHIRVAFGLYAVWHLVDALLVPGELLTLASILHDLVKVYVMYAVLVAVENKRRAALS